MPKFIYQSFFYKLIKIILINPFNYSYCYKVIYKLQLFFVNSKLFLSLKYYFNKSPYFLNSFSYINFKKFLSLLDIFFDKLNYFFSNIIKKSYTYSQLNELKNQKSNSKLFIISIMVGSLNLGYLFGNLIFSNNSILLPIVLLFISFTLYLFSKNLEYYRSSFIYKFFKYFLSWWKSEKKFSMGFNSFIFYFRIFSV